MAGRDMNDKEAAKSLLNDDNWQARLEEARVRRAKALREKERLKEAAGDQKKPMKPWDVEATTAKPVSPIVQERDLDRDDLDFADRVDAIRHTAQNAPEADNDSVALEETNTPPLDEATFLQDAAATLQPGAVDDAPTAETPDPGEVLVLSERYAAALDAFQNPERDAENDSNESDLSGDADVVVDLSDHYGAPDLELYPGADPELANRYAAAMAAFTKPSHAKHQTNDELSIAAGGRRLFMLSSLVVVVGFLTLPLMSAQPVETGPEVALAPSMGLQPGHGAQQSLQDTFAVAVPLLPRVAPVTPTASLPQRAANVVTVPAVLGDLVYASTAPIAATWTDTPVQMVHSILHDPLVADHTFVAGLSPEVTAPAEAVVRPQRLVQKLPEFNNVRAEVNPNTLEGSEATPLSGTLTVTALDTDTSFDALAAAIAEDVARALRR